MKTILFILFFMPCAVFANSYDDMTGEVFSKIPDKKRSSAIVVIPFSGDERDAKIATIETTKALINTGAVVVERAQIDKVLDEQVLQQSGVISDKEASAVGKALGAKYLLLGSTLRFNKYGVADNEGIKIDMRLVEISSFKTIAMATGEVSADDAVSTYMRKEPKKAARYPGFLELYGGVTKFQCSLTHFGEDDDNINGVMKPGYMFGLRLSPSTGGFFVSVFDFKYKRYGKPDWDYLSRVISMSWVPTIRVPLWSYFPSLPVYTNIYAGLSIGLAVGKIKFRNDDGDKDESTGFGLETSLRGGFKLGISESVSVFTEYQYYPRVAVFNRLSHAEDDSLDKDIYYGHAVIIGFSIAP